MRVTIYKEKEGAMSLLVEPSTGLRKVPVLVRGVTRQNLAETLTPIIEGLRRPTPAPLP